MRKIISAAVAAGIFAGLSASVYANDITVKLNGAEVSFNDVKPFIDEQNRVQVPVRAIAEGAGMMTEWDADEQKVSISSADIECIFTIGSPTATVKTGMEGGAYVYKVINMDTNAVIVNERTYIPVTYLAKAMSMTAEWDGESQTVNIVPGLKEEAHLNEYFPGDDLLPKRFFAEGYKKDDVPENIAESLSKTDIISGEGAFVEGIEDYNSSIDLTNSVYQQKFKLKPQPYDEEEKCFNITETPVFGSCENLAVRVELEGKPVVLTIDLWSIDNGGHMEFERKWNKEPVDKEVTAAFDNLDTSKKYYVNVTYHYLYTPEIDKVDGCVSVSQY